jgi:hypothetical protein
VKAVLFHEHEPYIVGGLQKLIYLVVADSRPVTKRFHDTLVDCNDTGAAFATV